MVTLFSMGSSIASNFQNGYFIADFLLSTLLVLLVTGFLAYEVRRVPVFIAYGVLDFLFLLVVQILSDYYLNCSCSC